MIFGDVVLLFGVGLFTTVGPIIVGDTMGVFVVGVTVGVVGVTVLGVTFELLGVTFELLGVTGVTLLGVMVLGMVFAGDAREEAGDIMFGEEVVPAWGTTDEVEFEADGDVEVDLVSEGADEFEVEGADEFESDGADEFESDGDAELDGADDEDGACADDEDGACADDEDGACADDEVGVDDEDGADDAGAAEARRGAGSEVGAGSGRGAGVGAGSAAGGVTSTINGAGALGANATSVVFWVVSTISRTTGVVPVAVMPKLWAAPDERSMIRFDEAAIRPVMVTIACR
jgi:hypothetical protein